MTDSQVRRLIMAAFLLTALFVSVVLFVAWASYTPTTTPAPPPPFQLLTSYERLSGAPEVHLRRALVPRKARLRLSAAIPHR